MTVRSSLSRLLLTVTLLFGALSVAQAGLFCTDAPFGIDTNGDGINDAGIVDGSQMAEVNPTGAYVGTVADPFPTQITIDANCTFRNFSASNPLDVTLNFQTNDPSIYLIVFDNTVFTGNMSCSNVDHKIWVVNSVEGGFKSSCQDLFIPVEAISKQNPAGKTSVAVGEPFSYTLSIPVLYDPATGTYISTTGSSNEISKITIRDDLNATGANLTLIGTPAVTWKSSGLPVPHTFISNSANVDMYDNYIAPGTEGSLKFIIDPAVTVPAGEQILINITVVADTTNTTGSTFFNTATWSFARVIYLDTNGDGIEEPVSFEPLPGEDGATQTMTIAAPNLEVSKSSSDTLINLIDPVLFTIDVQNTGASDAWHTTIVDQLPDTPTAGTCPDTVPALSVQRFAADGTTPLGLPLSPANYSVSYTNSTGTPKCQLSLTMLTAAAIIGPDEYLRITYSLDLDPDTTATGIGLTNIAAATRWYSADGAFPRTEFNRTLTNGTPGVLDHEDSYTITTSLSGYFFQKTVSNLTTGETPTSAAASGDRLRYRLRLLVVDKNIENIFISDILDPAYFNLGSFSFTPPAGIVYFLNTTTGELQITGSPLPLNLGPTNELILEFDINLLPGLTNGTVVPNQARLTATDTTNVPSKPVDVLSDNPFVNGLADPENPASIFDTTDVIIQTPGPLAKINPAKTTATIGEQLTYLISVPAVPVNVPLYDVKVFDDLSATGVDMRLVSASVVAGGSWTATNTGSSTSLVLEDLSTGIDIPANGQVVIAVTVQLFNSLINQSGITFSNTASYTYNRANGVNTTVTAGTGASTPLMTVVEPAISSITKTANNTSPTSGSVIRYTVNLTAASGTGLSDVLDVVLTDTLELGLIYVGNPTVSTGSGVSADNVIADPDIIGDGITTPQSLYWAINSNLPSDIDIAAGETITISYDVRVDASVLAGQVLTNSVVAQWSSLDGASNAERTGVDGAGGLNDYITTAITETVTVPDINAPVSKIRLSDTYGAADDNVRVGDLVDYELRITAPEGTLVNLQLVDTLPAGLQFEGIVSINGNTGPAPYTAVAPFSHSDITAANIIYAGNPSTGPTTLTLNLGNVTNLANDGLSDDFIIIYRARVLDNVLAQSATATPLNNSVTISYDTVSGTITSQDTDTIINVQQPLVVMNKTAAPAGGDTIVVASELIDYTINVVNQGSAPAYDVVVEDIVPAGLRQAGVTTLSITLVNTASNTVTATLANLAPSYDPATGILSWNFDTGVSDAYTIPVGETLRIVYQVQADASIGPGLTLTNAATALNYYSFDDEAVPSLGGVNGVRQVYGPSNTATDTLTTAPGAPLKENPVVASATIGQEFTYTITVPQVAQPTPLYDVRILDDLSAITADVTLVSISNLSGGSWVPVNTGSATSLVIEDVTSGIDIPANQQIVLGITLRINNTVANVAGNSFTNTASYTYNQLNGDVASQLAGGSSTTPAMSVVEPVLSATKTATNATAGKLPTDPVTGGDLLQYVVTITNSGTSTAYDINVVDTLPAELLYYSGFTPTATIAGTPVSGFVATPSGTPAGPLLWGRDNADGSLDLPAGSTLVITYQAQVQVSSAVSFSNSVWVDWTSLDGLNTNERSGAGCPTVAAPDNYCFGPASVTSATTDTNSLNKVVTADTWITDGSTAVDNLVRIGDLTTYQLQLRLGEGLTSNVQVSDVLPVGLVYEGLASISPASGSGNFTYSVVSQPVAGSTGTLVWNLGDVNNAPSNDGTPVDVLTIEYVVRVLDYTPAQQNLPVQTNTATLTYTGSALVADPNVLISSASLTIRQPNLGVTKISSPVDGSTISASQVVTYTVDLINSGNAPAYDTQVEDVLPFGLRQSGITTTSMSLVNAGTVLPVLAPVYDPATGVISWNLDTGTANTYTIPAGDTLRIVYQVQADANLSASLTMSNAAVAQNYYSFDDEAVPVAAGFSGTRQIYGPTNTATTTLFSPAPGALLKENPAGVSTVSIGETITYRVTVPATPVAVALNDVRILDNLTASAATLSFVSVTRVSGTQPWTPVNTGSSTNLVIEDTTNGIDIPAGEQVVIEITVQVDDSATNVSGLFFNNTADYTYNQINNDPATQLAGAPYTSTPDLQIVGPDNLTMEKSGPATMRIGIAGDFTLNVQNTGTATAWDITITDQLPNLSPGGMCNTAPANIVARIYQADGVTPVSPVLVQNSDYVVNFAGDPTCIMTITMQSAAAALPAGNRLIITYQASLDVDTVHSTSLINIAGTTEWFSNDTAGSGATGQTRTYTRVLTDGTTASLDHEDAHTVISEAPIIQVQKTVQNQTTGQPGSTASPGDTLRYSILITNVSDVDVPSFSLVDEIDALNAAAGFAAGSLSLVTVPAGADTSNTSSTGGASGTGLVDIRNLSLGIQGSATASVLVEFDVTLLPVITSGSVILNQGHLLATALDLPTDDPAINGVDNPNVLGDEDPTRTVITAAPAFEVFKTSADLTGDPAILLSGDTLRYTITVKNIGTENAINTVLRDLVPANTTYVANSTTLNGVVVADPSAGISPLQNGMLVNAPEDTTAGNMRADASATTNVATITFDVVINANVVNGTIISNQAHLNAVGAGSGVMPEQVSDDPSTAALNDPTIDIVGNQALVDAVKTVSIVQDNGTAGIVDPGDVLRYTIIISNIGTSPVSGVTFSDGVPVNTTYVANSVQLNGIAITDAAVGVSPLIAGIDVSSSDLTPPLPSAGNGTLSAGGGTATIIFDVTVDAGATTGTIISNQGTVDINGLLEPTDADGDDSNGDQPTLTVVGDAQLLQITKDVSVIGGGAALASSQLEYTVTVTNIGLVPALDVVISDTLNTAQMTYVAGSALLNGATAGTSFAGSTIMANYSATYGALPAGQSATLHFRVDLASTLNTGDVVTNTANVSWNAASQTASASIATTIGTTPGSSALTGQIWQDANFNNIYNAGEPQLANWTVELYKNGSLLVGSVQTDSSGNFVFSGVAPTIAGDTYELRYIAPAAVASSARLGRAYSELPPGTVRFSDDYQRISAITVPADSVVTDLNMPITPNGVVYDAVLRTPIAGATVSLRQSDGSLVPSACFTDPNQQNQVTLASGYYKFDLDFNAIGCTAVSGADYAIDVTPPATGYNAWPSVIIPSQTTVATAYSVATCAADAITGTTPDYCEAVVSPLQPAVSVAPQTPGTNYYSHLVLDSTSQPATSQMFNNHLPVDPQLNNALSIIKTSALLNVTRGQMVPYTITVSNTLPVNLTVNIVDNFPAGFKYVPGSARYNGVVQEPVQTGLQLAWNNIVVPVGATHRIDLLLIVGAGVSDGDYVNRAQVIDSFGGGAASGEATATVRVVPDPNFDCSDVIGKVFDDRNLNGVQDASEPGIAGARVVTARGLVVTADKQGRFHVSCAIAPNESRGSNFILKLDERSLPTGYRVVTENPRVQRATRGKLLKFNFGATLHRVVSLDMADEVFEPDSDEMRPQWRPRLGLLLEQLEKQPSVLRLTYLADVEKPGLVNDRLEKVKDEIIEKWQSLNHYRLTIETEVFWRRGSPPDRGDID